MGSNISSVLLLLLVFCLGDGVVMSGVGCDY